VSLVEQELLTLPEHLSSPSVFSGVRVTRSLVLYVCFVDRCLYFCTSSFGHCVVCSSSIYGFWLPLWYLQTLPCRVLKHKSYSSDWETVSKIKLCSLNVNVIAISGHIYCISIYWCVDRYIIINDTLLTGERILQIPL
jgi:hypothetical protein